MSAAYLYLENGVLLEGESFGAKGTASGEIVFNTSISGYQEIVTDPSYAGQFIAFTMPEIGNVGVNKNDSESEGVFARAIIVRNYQKTPSNFRSQEPLGEFLKRKNIVGVCNVDTRVLTKLIRKEGAMMAVVSTEFGSYANLRAVLDKAPRMSDVNFLNEVGTKKPYIHRFGAWNTNAQAYDPPSGAEVKKIVAFDFGAKLNIFNELTVVGLQTEVVPPDTKADDIMARFDNQEIGGVFLSNGPGDPLALKDQIREIKRLINRKIPIFGICLGHQLLSIAHGYETYKLKFGHHGANQPVKNTQSGAIEITSQNHNYSAPDSIVEIAQITHINLFDDTIEGVKYKESPIFSVQYHPEASPGPRESRYLFKQFADAVLPTPSAYWNGDKS
ncbi:MAG: glutamine-hydrolyzing carbamoyl-phosphate synthase small subunit [Helicobacteraceae bacterium]|jgi:carbamoyl-phosphate synthase small subunit|nr:glutamine-hydrolyzing carbamoyl-phosphate synthase small subunit [Helicobacteraceae bacterium]